MTDHGYRNTFYALKYQQDIWQYYKQPPYQQYNQDHLKLDKISKLEDTLN